MDAVILCGGRGKRLGVLLKDRPKPMIKIHDRPFLDILIDHIATLGIKRIILCIGYKGEMIKEHYSEGGSSPTIFFSEERKALGTAGALKNARSLIKSNPFLVMNGDSFCQISLEEFIRFHRKKRGLCSIALSEAQDSNDYGKVTLESSGRVVAFDEKKKTRSADHLVSAGIYLLDQAIFAEIPESKPSSMEYDIFPKIVNRRFYGFVTQKSFIDIGTPERLQQAGLPGKLGFGRFP